MTKSYKLIKEEFDRAMANIEEASNEESSSKIDGLRAEEISLWIDQNIRRLRRRRLHATNVLKILKTADLTRDRDERLDLIVQKAKKAIGKNFLLSSADYVPAYMKTVIAKSGDPKLVKAFNNSFFPLKVPNSSLSREILGYKNITRVRRNLHVGSPIPDVGEDTVWGQFDTESAPTSPKAVDDLKVFFAGYVSSLKRAEVAQEALSKSIWNESRDVDAELAPEQGAPAAEPQQQAKPAAAPSQGKPEIEDEGEDEGEFF